MQPLAGLKFDPDFKRNYTINFARPIARSPTCYEAYPATYNPDKQNRIVERIPKTKLDEKKMREMLGGVKATHPNMELVYEWSKDESYLYLVHENCLEMNLEARLTAVKTLKETHAAIVVRQVLRALNYCRANSVVYQALRPSQILFPSGYEALKVKVTNPEITLLLSQCSTGPLELGEPPYYEAPEALSGKTEMESAMWSLGVITYRMVTAKVPFDGKRPDDIKKSIGKGTISFIQAYFGNKHDCQDFISKLITSREKRMTPEEALSHPWIVKNTVEFVQKEASLSPAIVKALVKFADMEDLKRVLLSFLVSTLEARELEAATKTFMALDKNNDGKLTKEELKEGMKTFAEADKLLEFLEKADQDQSGDIDYREFCTASLGNSICKNKDKMAKGFSFLDKNKDGFISTHKLLEILKPFNTAVTQEELNRLIDKMDINKDGRISLKELQGILKEK